MTFDGKETFKFDTGATAASGNYAYRSKDLGNFSAPTGIISFGLYHDALGSTGDEDYFRMQIGFTDVLLQLRFGTDGLFVYDGSSWNEVGTDEVNEDVWQDWTCLVKNADDYANSTCDVYLDGVLVEADVDCSQQGSAHGYVYLSQYGSTTANRITYLDYFVAGDSLLAYVLANTTYDEEDCSDITDWTDYDGGSGESTQVIRPSPSLSPGCLLKDP